MVDRIEQPPRQPLANSESDPSSKPSERSRFEVVLAQSQGSTTPSRSQVPLPDGGLRRFAAHPGHQREVNRFEGVLRDTSRLQLSQLSQPGQGNEAAAAAARAGGLSDLQSMEHLISEKTRNQGHGHSLFQEGRFLRPGELIEASSLEAAFQAHVSFLANTAPDSLRQILQQSFANVDRFTRERLFRQAETGRFPVPAATKWVDGGLLHGLVGAYSPPTAGGGGTIFLNELLRGEPLEALAVYSEQVGHHVDRLLAESESVREQGQIFGVGLMHGEALSAEELAATRVDGERGDLRFDGGSVSVEFGQPQTSIWLQQAYEAQTVGRFIDFSMAALTGIAPMLLSRGDKALIEFVPPRTLTERVASLGRTLDHILEGLNAARLPEADLVRKQVGRQKARFLEALENGDLARAKAILANIFGRLRQVQVVSRLTESGAAIRDLDHRIPAVDGGSATRVSLVAEDSLGYVFAQVKTGSELDIGRRQPEWGAFLRELRETVSAAEGVGGATSGLAKARVRYYLDDASNAVRQTLLAHGVEIVDNGRLARSSEMVSAG